MPLDRNIGRVALSFFLPFRRRVSARLGLLEALTLKLHERRFLQETPFMEALKSLIGDSSLKTAVFIGTPGSYSKNTVLFLSTHARPFLLAKIASTFASKENLLNEAHWLKRLSSNTTLHQSIPKYISELVSDDSHVLIQSICPGIFPGKDLSSIHIKFLSSFQNDFLEGNYFIGSLMHRAMANRFSALQGKLIPQWAFRIEKGMRILEREFQAGKIPIVSAHRDFAPWNIKLNGVHLSLFDWEYASRGYLPLYDLFHFVLMPLAVKTNIAPNQMPSIIFYVKAHSKNLTDSEAKTRKADVQLLAYLLDVSLFYLESNNGQHIGDNVVIRFGYLIDSFEQWRT